MGGRGFQKLFWLWIVKWPGWLERNLWIPLKTSRFTQRVQRIIQGLLAWRRRDSTLQWMWDISMPLMRWKVVKGKQQVQSGLWRSVVSRNQLWVKESQFSTLWKMVQSVDSFEKSWVSSWRNSGVNLANRINIKDAENKEYVDEKTKTTDLFTFLLEYANIHSRKRNMLVSHRPQLQQWNFS